ncbi:MAG: DUF1922 domain-containing protein [Candidatus Parvarchaeota archaeon]|nr:DUF1922 domain-containing protein [Candidatus Haiyanarchaeum thermophilum]
MVEIMVKCENCGFIKWVKAPRYQSYTSCPVCGRNMKLKAVRGGKIKVVQCPSCNTFQATKSKNRFKCRICGRSTEMSKLKVYASVDNARDASIIVRKLNSGKT